MDNTFNSSKIQNVTITKAFVNDVWYFRLYINQELIQDFLTIQEAVSILHTLVTIEEFIVDKPVD